MIVQSDIATVCGCGKASSSDYDGFIVCKELGKCGHAVNLVGPVANHGNKILNSGDLSGLQMWVHTGKVFTPPGKKSDVELGVHICRTTQFCTVTPKNLGPQNGTRLTPPFRRLEFWYICVPLDSAREHRVAVNHLNS